MPAKPICIQIHTHYATLVWLCVILYAWLDTPLPRPSSSSSSLILLLSNLRLLNTCIALRLLCVFCYSTRVRLPRRSLVIFTSFYSSFDVKTFFFNASRKRQACIHEHDHGHAFRSHYFHFTRIHAQNVRIERSTKKYSLYSFYLWTICLHLCLFTSNFPTCANDHCSYAVGLYDASHTHYTHTHTRIDDAQILFTHVSVYLIWFPIYMLCKTKANKNKKTPSLALIMQW